MERSHLSANFQPLYALFRILVVVQYDSIELYTRVCFFDFSISFSFDLSTFKFHTNGRVVELVRLYFACSHVDFYSEIFPFLSCIYLNYP